MYHIHCYDRDGFCVIECVEASLEAVTAKILSVGAVITAVIKVS